VRRDLSQGEHGEQQNESDTGEAECFVVGPIGDRLAPLGSPEREVYERSIQVWEEVIQTACDQLNITPIRADHISRPGEITDQTFRLLRDADAVIADVTGGNPNVMYELGLRHTKNKLTIQLGEQGRLPFDINIIRTIRFNRTERGLIEAREALRAALEAGLRGQFDQVTATRVWNEAEGPPLAALEESHLVKSQAAEEEPGFLELLAESEEAMPRLIECITEMGRIINQMGELSRSATDELSKSDSAGGGAGGRLAITIRFAKALSDRAASLELLAADYEEQMKRIDPGVSYLISRLEEEPDLQAEAPDFVPAISTTAQATREGMVSLQTLSDSIEPLELVARPLRPVARQIRSALRRVKEASGVVSTWERKVGAVTETSRPGDGHEQE
jgi:hypothetical protein